MVRVILTAKLGNVRAFLSRFPLCTNQPARYRANTKCTLLRPFSLSLSLSHLGHNYIALWRVISSHRFCSHYHLLIVGVGHCYWILLPYVVKLSNENNNSTSNGNIVVDNRQTIPAIKIIIIKTYLDQQ